MAGGLMAAIITRPVSRPGSCGGAQRGQAVIITVP
jgi:hypothetical protein